MEIEDELSPVGVGQEKGERKRGGEGKKGEERGRERGMKGQENRAAPALRPSIWHVKIHTKAIL